MYRGKYATGKSGNSPRQETAQQQQEDLLLPEEDLLPKDENLPLQEEPQAQPAPQPSKSRKKRPATKGTRIFYSIYAAFILVFFIALAVVLPKLQNWLVKYEASQPETKSKEVFTQLFSAPDWQALYTMTQQVDTSYENKDIYAAYMQQKVGSTQLQYTETSAGLSGDHKYMVMLGEEKIATFTLTDKSERKAEIPDWTLGKVELFFARNQSVTVEKQPGQTVFINGVALDDSHTIRTVATKAEEYLPEGIHGYRMEQQQLDGLMAPPTVTITNADGSNVPVKQNAETGIWSPDVAAFAPMSDAEKELILNAAKADLKFAIRDITSQELAKYFDSHSKIYKDKTHSLAFVQKYQNYAFDEKVTAVKDFYRYSDKLFSANVVLKMNVTRWDGSIRTFDSDTTYFFTQKDNGKFLVTDISNISVQEPLEQVRLTFLSEGETLDSFLVSSSAHSFKAPQVTVPEGKEFAGWAEKTTDENGKITMTIRFVPGEDGTVQLGSDPGLKPMVLHAVFKNK